MQDFNATVHEFVSLVQQGNFNEALDRFYDENIVSFENEDQSTQGLQALKEETRRFLAATTGLNAEPLNMIISDDISVVEWHYQFTHARMGVMDYRQVSLQRWKNGRIVLERHHYQTPG